MGTVINRLIRSFVQPTRYKEFIWEDKSGGLWRVDPNTDTMIEIKPRPSRRNKK